VPSPACGSSTPFCLAGECVQCLPSTYVATCLPEAGGLEYCSEAGVITTNACPCANAECQAWPTGSMGACRYDAGTYTRYDPGTTLDCRSLVIDNDATVAFLVNPEAGVIDAGPAWTLIGVVSDAVINGMIVSQVDSLGKDMTVKASVPAGDGGRSEDISFTFVQAKGGAGGTSGWTCAGNFSDGGLPAFGNGGGGGAGTQVLASGVMNAGPSSCATLCGTTTTGDPGQNAGRWRGGTGGASPDALQPGGDGGVVFGEAGSAGAGSPSSGGGGGSRGRHGGLLYLRVLGTVSGTGSVQLSGQAGGPGGPGAAFNATIGPACGGPPFGIENIIGGASGGGGAGGCGGAFVLRCPNDASAFLSQVDVSGGGGGFQSSPGGNNDQEAGANGPPGRVDAGPVPP
jgi:hypothetical protein